MRRLDRRAFLRTSLAAFLGTAALKSKVAQAQVVAPPSDFILPKRKLGSTGLSCSLLGIGTGTNGWGGRSAQTELGRRALVSLLEHAYDRSVTYFDLADQYGSHTYMRDALKENGGTIPRENVFILTKTHARSAEEMRRDLDRYRKEIGTDHLDLVLLHCKFSDKWPDEHRGAMDALAEAKQKGIVRAHGVSCHSLQALKTAAAEPWVDVDLARLNPWGKHMDADVETVKGVLQQMRDAGKGVIGMKILAQGEASNLEEAINHAVTCGLLDCFTIGMRNRTELDQLLGLLHQA